MTDEKARPKIGAAIDQLIEILEKFDEAQRRTILAAVSSQLELELGVAPPPIAPKPGAAPAPELIPQKRPKQPLLDIRILKEDKKPTSAQQMIALAGYYVQEVEGDGNDNDTFTAGDMNKLFKQAGFPLPKNMAQALINTKNGIPGRDDDARCLQAQPRRL